MAPVDKKIVSNRKIYPIPSKEVISFLDRLAEILAENICAKNKNQLKGSENND